MRRQQQGGGTGSTTVLPYRWTHPDAVAFRPCDDPNAVKGTDNKGPQEGGAVRMPYRYFHADATAFKPCDANGYKSDDPAYQLSGEYPAKQLGGAAKKAMAKAQEDAMKGVKSGCHGCACNAEEDGQLGGGAANEVPPQYQYYGDLNGNYQECIKPRMQQQPQKGGFATHAHWGFWPGNELPQVYPVTDGPTFVRTGRSKHWAKKY